MVDWKQHTDASGNFVLPTYLYKVIMNLMKQSLDLGTLLSDDKNKLRAYKERVKQIFKDQWLDLAESLEKFDLVIKCECYYTHEYCTLCGGSRYQINQSLSPSVMTEVAVITHSDDSELAKKLEEGLQKALQQVARMRA